MEIPIIYDQIYDDPKVMDYQKWWFTKLRIEMYRNEDRPGYVPNNPLILRAMVGCQSANLWSNKSSVVLDRFQLTADGGWYFDESVLCLLGSTDKPKEEGIYRPPSRLIERELYLDIKQVEEVTALSIYEKYPRKVGKDKALTSIDKAIDKFAKELKISPAESAERILEATTEFAKSPAGNRGNYTPHPTTWFNQGRFKDDRSEWYRTENNGSRPTKADAAFDFIRNA